jgi:hypothetical protein
VDAARARVGVENLDARLASLENRLTNLSRLLWASLAALGLVLILVALRAFR